MIVEIIILGLIAVLFLSWGGGSLCPGERTDMTKRPSVRPDKVKSHDEEILNLGGIGSGGNSSGLLTALQWYYAPRMLYNGRLAPTAGGLYYMYDYFWQFDYLSDPSGLFNNWNMRCWLCGSWDITKRTVYVEQWFMDYWGTPQFAQATYEGLFPGIDNNRRTIRCNTCGYEWFPIPLYFRVIPTSPPALGWGGDPDTTFWMSYASSSWTRVESEYFSALQYKVNGVVSLDKIPIAGGTDFSLQSEAMSQYVVVTNDTSPLDELPGLGWGGSLYPVWSLEGEQAVAKQGFVWSERLYRSGSELSRSRNNLVKVQPIGDQKVLTTRVEQDYQRSSITDTNYSRLRGIWQPKGIRASGDPAFPALVDGDWERRFAPRFYYLHGYMYPGAYSNSYAQVLQDERSTVLKYGDVEIDSARLIGVGPDSCPWRWGFGDREFYLFYNKSTTGVGGGWILRI